MKHISVAVVSLLLAGCVLGKVHSPDTTSEWFLGQWEMVADEDKSAPYDLMEFRQGGIWVNYGPDCKEFKAQFHVHEGSLYVTFEVAEKGPAAMVFRPTADHSTLTYTSPRTRNNATYKRPERSPCQPG